MMTGFPEWPAILTILGMVAGCLGIALRLSMRIAVVEFKVSTMWSFQMRRGFSEVINTGIGTIASPLTFNANVEKALDPIRDELIAFGRTMNSQTSDAEALLLIESEFGERLLRFVCVPCHLSHGACLLLALVIAKGKNEITLNSIPPSQYPISSFFGRLKAAARGLVLATSKN